MSDARSEEAASDVVESVYFTFYTPEEIRKISVKSITKAVLFDAKNAPVVDGLLDPALGPVNNTDACKSCGQKIFRCPGHCGHIDFAKPLYHPLLFKNLKALLQVTCFYCHKFRMSAEKVKKYTLQLDLIMKGRPVEAKNLDINSLSDTRKKKRRYGDESETKSSGNLKQWKWTSLQQSEALTVLSNFLSEKKKKCEKCGRRNPTIKTPIFGWFNKVLHGSDIRANIIEESNLGLVSMEIDAPISSLGPEENNHEDLLSRGDGASLTDDENSVPAKGKRKPKRHLKDLPAEVVEQLRSSGQNHLLPSEVEFVLEELWRNEADLCRLICNIQAGDLNVLGGHTMFLLKALLIPPSKFRPPAGTASGAMLEHPQNILLSKLQYANINLYNLITKNPGHPEIVRRWMDLQQAVNVLFDSSKGLGKSDKEASGIRQLLERKAGILRQKMMGKRVNYACRTVISPDPYLAVNEIGIPPNFALRLTYPVRVTPWNANELRALLINGADVHPGATLYKDKDSIYKLQVDKNKRIAISRKLPTSRVSDQSGKGLESDFEGKILYVHLRDGDIVLLNRQHAMSDSGSHALVNDGKLFWCLDGRQGCCADILAASAISSPTLHKPSMMAHIVRILPGLKTFRMHYANCSTYNADFDGDEMNVHLPQDEISRAESFHIVDANKQYIVPTSGDPIRGLIQDHIVSAVLLTKKDTFFTCDEYYQLVYGSCVPGSVSSCHISKFGQKVSTFSSDDEIQPLPPAIWKPTPLWTGKQVITAILNYVARGKQPFTIEKDGKIPREYLGNDSSEHKLLVFNNEFIHGMIDKAQFGKYGLVHTVYELYGADSAGVLLSMFSRLFTMYLQFHGFTCGVDDLLIGEHPDLRRKKILETSEKESEQVHLQFVNHKSTGFTNLQKEIEKVIRKNVESETARLDRMMSNRLNSITSEVNNALFPKGLVKTFPNNCLSLMTSTGAKGGLVNMTQISSLLGQQELEGKRVPRMISGKTLPCFLPWDISSRAGGFISDRFLTGLRPQEYYFHCMAGRDGLVDTAVKTSRSGYLQRCLVKNLEGLKVCYDYTVRDADGSVFQFMYGEDGVDVLKTNFLTELEPVAANKDVLLEKITGKLKNTHLSKSNAFIQELPHALKEKAKNFVRSSSKKGFLHQIEKKELMNLLKLKYLSSLADPGEAVGVIAAQSVGEPSTQMTLNTFHLAGRGEMNVTLGIPRLQEILMNAKENISTPVMTCPLLDQREKEDAEDLAATLRRITVADIVEKMEVCTIPLYIHEQEVSTLLKLKIKLYHPELLNMKLFCTETYRLNSGITLETYEETLKGPYASMLNDAIAKHLEMVSKISGIAVSQNEETSIDEGKDEDEPHAASGQGEDGGGGSDDDNETAEDQGADAEKRKRQACDEMEYEDDGLEKERSAMVDDYDGELAYASEVDQVENDEDYVLGGEDQGGEAEMEASEGPSEPQTPEAGTKEQKPKAMKSSGSKGSKKTNRIIKTKFEKTKFEVFILLRKEPHILLAEVAQKTAKKVFLKESKNIERCTVVERKKQTDPYSLQTAGVNFHAFWDLEDHLDVNRIVTNDIHAMLNTYGVEAARATIVNEVKAVFGAYGIQVNIRHLSLIADFMTFNGGYRPMNRLGMDNFGTSPFGKMTFETATKFIVEAAMHGEVDQLEAPSASICLGQPVKMGTGCFDLMQNLQL